MNLGMEGRSWCNDPHISLWDNSLGTRDPAFNICDSTLEDEFPLNPRALLIQSEGLVEFSASPAMVDIKVSFQMQ